MSDHPRLPSLGSAALVLLHEQLPLNELASLFSLCRRFCAFQNENWFLWQRLLEREAPEDAERLAKKAANKQNAKVWRGAVIGQAKQTSQMLGKHGSRALQAAQKRLASASDNVASYLAGKELVWIGGSLRAASYLREDEYGSLLPPPWECSARLEAAWEEGGEEAPTISVHKEAMPLLKRGVPWRGKWDKPRGLLEFIAIACAPPGAVDAILDVIPLGDIPLPALLSGLFEAVRCHRSHLLTRLLDSFVELPADPRLVAIACYTKNRGGLQMLLERRADPNERCSPSRLAFPLDDGILMSESGSTAARASPFELAVRGRSRLSPEMWSEAPLILDQLLVAGALVHDTNPLQALLSQVAPNVDDKFSAHLKQSQKAWVDCFHAVTNMCGCPRGEQWLHVAQMPEYLVTLLNSGLLPAGAAAERDPHGISVVAKCALRASHMSCADEWLPIILLLLQEPGNEDAASQVVDLVRLPGSWKATGPDPMWPCPVLQMALRCGHSELLRRSLTQSTIDAYSAWKVEFLAATPGWNIPDRSSLIYSLSKVGASTMKEAIQRGLRFSRSDTLRCHDAVGTLLGPVGCLALAAAEAADETEQALFGRLAVQLLDTGIDDPQVLVCQNGVPGGLADLVALTLPGGYLDRLPDGWFDPILVWLAR